MHIFTALHHLHREHAFEILIRDFSTPVKQVYTPPPVKQVYTPPPVKQVYSPPPVKHVYTPPPVKPVYTPPPVKQVHTPPPVKYTVANAVWTSLQSPSLILIEVY